MREARVNGEEGNDKGKRVLYMAMELGEGQWKLALSDGGKLRHVTMAARDLFELQGQMKKARRHFGLADTVGVLSCYEAGRDGFWLHRFLMVSGIGNSVVDSSSIEVNRRLRRSKTDRLDAGKLLGMLMRYHGGEGRVWRVVRVPSVEQEDARQLHRELEVLKKEHTMHSNRIRALLVQQGIGIRNPRARDFSKRLGMMRTWDGCPLPGDLQARLIREWERVRLVREQIRELRRTQKMRLEVAATPSLKKVARLKELRGIGNGSAWTFVMEFFGRRQFRNRREVGALAGLCPSPYQSGKSRREQGIGKDGNRRIRTLSVEIAWSWLRYQPDSKLSQWFVERFGSGGSRMRRIGIVAMARKLLIDLWRFLEYGVVPDGARLRTMA